MKNVSTQESDKEKEILSDLEKKQDKLALSLKDKLLSLDEEMKILGEMREVALKIETQEMRLDGNWSKSKKTFGINKNTGNKPRMRQ